MSSISNIHSQAYLYRQIPVAPPQTPVVPNKEATNPAQSPERHWLSAATWHQSPLDPVCHCLQGVCHYLQWKLRPTLRLIPAPKLRTQPQFNGSNKGPGGPSRFWIGVHRLRPSGQPFRAQPCRWPDNVEYGTAYTLLHRMGRRDIVPHGFRSTFRDWAAEQTSFPREVAEMALAHCIWNAVEAAYRRGDLMAKHQKLMAAWAAYCERPKAGSSVLPFTKAG